jgi:hypothetical protein
VRKFREFEKKKETCGELEAWKFWWKTGREIIKDVRILARKF